MNDKVITDIKTKMINLIDSRDKEIADIELHIENERSTIKKCNAAMECAINDTDIDAYTKAKAEKITAENAVEMYSARLSRLINKKMISEQESDSIIDKILEYEKDLELEFEKEASKIIADLKAKQKEYRNRVDDAEATLNAWTTRIHENYRASGTTYTDGTNRSKAPVPVHRVPYTGSDFSQAINKFINSLGK